jgi:FkbM family methyltransferase
MTIPARLSVHPRELFVDRVVGWLRPSWRAHLQWEQLRRRGSIECRVVDLLVRRGDTAVDVGTNWGLFSYRLRRLVGPEGHVYGFEPSPAMEPALRRLARLQNVTVERVGLSDHEGRAELRIPVVGGRLDDYRAHVVPAPAVAADGVTFAVQVARLDDFLPFEGPAVSFIKCDVEGYELAVLRGACETLRRSRPRLLVEIEQRHTQTDVAETFALMRQQSYQGYMLARRGLRPIEMFDVRRDQLDLLDGDHGQPLCGYVNQFLFLPVERPAPELAPLLAA